MSTKILDTYSMRSASLPHAHPPFPLVLSSPFSCIDTCDTKLIRIGQSTEYGRYASDICFFLFFLCTPGTMGNNKGRWAPTHTRSTRPVRWMMYLPSRCCILLNYLSFFSLPLISHLACLGGGFSHGQADLHNNPTSFQSSPGLNRSDSSDKMVIKFCCDRVAGCWLQLPPVVRCFKGQYLVMRRAGRVADSLGPRGSFVALTSPVSGRRTAVRYGWTSQGRASNPMVEAL